MSAGRPRGWCRSPRATPAAPGSWPAAPAAISCSAPARPTAAIRTSSPTSPGPWPLTRPRRRLSLRRARSSFICDHLAAGTPLRDAAGHHRHRQAGSLARYARHVDGAAPSKAALRACGARSAEHGRRRAGHPRARQRPGEQTVAFAAELIDRTGKAPVIEAALAHRTGRPRPLPVRAVLTALLCLALDDRPLFLTEATRLLFCQLSAASRRLLGVPGTATTERAFLAAYRRVRYCFGAICSVAGPLARCRKTGG